MARISPFYAYRYNPERITDPGTVIAPPYDVITEQMRRRLIERDPHNIIRLILPEGSSQEKYNNAAGLMEQWLATGILRSDEIEAVYLYAQIFAHPVTGEPVERRGFIAALGLEPFSSGIVLPHERTLSGPKADRLKLMEATDANLEPIFGIYRDSSGDSSQRLDAIMAAEQPMLEATDMDGVHHRLWRIDDTATIDALRRDLETNVVFIVDGHHRYETALNYREERHRQNEELPDDAPVDYIMMFLAPTSDPGLIILPTHRVIHSLESFDLDALLQSLEQHFRITSHENHADALTELEQHASRPAYGLLSDNRAFVAVLRDGVTPQELSSPELPEALRTLDVTILHEHILEQLLSITRQAQEEQRNLRYVKSLTDAETAAAQDDVQLVVLMNATRLDQVESVAQSGEVMPQKSTYFYPKLASGLLIRPLHSKNASQ